MPITNARLRQLNTDVDVAILQGSMTAHSSTILSWDRFAMKKKIGVGKGTYAAMNNTPLVQRKGPSGYPWTEPAANTNDIVSTRVGTGVKIPIDDITDDKWGVWAPIVSDMGFRIERFPQYLTAEWLMEGDQSTGPANTFMYGRDMRWIDGLPFFSATHKVNIQNSSLSTFSNLLTGTALSATNLGTTYAKFLELPDTEGKRRGIPPNRLIVPPELEIAGAQLLQAMTVTTGGVNIQSNDSMAQRGRPRIELVVVPELTDTGIWYMGAVLEGMSAPVIYQVTEELIMVPKTDPRDDNMYYDDEAHYLTKGRADVGWGDPRLIIRAEA